jgi:hypothetical protein
VDESKPMMFGICSVYYGVIGINEHLVQVPVVLM